MDNFSLADIKAVTDNNENGWGNNGMLWIIILFIVLFGGFGGNGWGNNRSDEVLNTDFAVLERKLDGINNGLCDGFFAMNNAVKDGNYALARDIQTVAANQEKCCCETKQEILTNRYEAEKNTCKLETAIHAEGEATRALLRENEIQNLRDKVSAMELQNAMCGVMRYPTSTAYSAGPWPFACGCGNSCCNDGCGNNNRAFF